MLEQFGLSAFKSAVIHVGEVYGRLTVLGVGKRHLAPRVNEYYAVCKCSCGSPAKLVSVKCLKQGTTLSCGCFHRDRVTTHGLEQNQFYGRWSMMLDRCYNPKNKSFKNYGGRGIRVCDRWFDVRAYVADLPEGYFEGAELDRIDNDRNYEPGNVHWVTSLANNGNRRSSKNITFNGKTQNLVRWSEEVGVAYRTLRFRIKNGWSIEAALTTPTLTPIESGIAARKAQLSGKTLKGRAQPKTDRRKRYIEFRGDILTVGQISELTGTSKKTIYRRFFELGWPIEKAVIA